MKLGINPYCIQIMQDLKDINEEKGLSYMRYIEDWSVQKQSPNNGWADGQ